VTRSARSPERAELAPDLSALHPDRGGYRGGAGLGRADRVSWLRAAWSIASFARRGAQAARRRPDGVQAMGSGVADLALGLDVVARARRSGAGRAIEPAKRARVRLRSKE
jgi:hypothetical protein